MFAKVSYNQYVCDIVLSPNQQKHLVAQVISQLGNFYLNGDSRKMVLNAFTGSGKTTVSIKALVPEFIEQFAMHGKRVLGFMAPRKEVVDGAYKKAKNSLHNKKVDGKLIKVYNSKDIDKIKKEIEQGDTSSKLDGDIVMVFLTAQYFYLNYDLLTQGGSFDLMIVDEAHIMFGTIDKTDTKADKGVTNNNFEAWTLNKLRALSNCAVLFLTATPTNSQKELTPLGVTNNIYLDPMPRDILTTPFYDVIPYLDNEDTLRKGLEYFKQYCDKIGNVIASIDTDTWETTKKNIFATYPALMARIGRRGTTNGVDFDLYIDEIRDLCIKYGFTLFISTSEGKEFDGKKIESLEQGVTMGDKHHHTPVVMVTIDSGYAGVDYVKISNVIIGREPSGTIHNNYSQTAGRAARMKFGFTNHATAAETIRKYDLTDDQKRLIAEYYILHSTSTVHVPVDSVLLNTDVKEFIETDTFREPAGRKYILGEVFSGSPVPDLKFGLHLKVSSSLQDESYKQYKKNYCECCKTVKFVDGEYTDCWISSKIGFQNLIGAKISKEEMNILWPMCLHVHHMDGNHFNNDPKNLKTICPNVHSLVTMYNEDYKNRYPELHEALKILAKKKGKLKPKMLDFI
jgi:hypothetical protein